MNPNEKYREQVQPFLTSKCEEFKLLDYHNVTEDLLWNYLLEMKWRRLTEASRLHQVVADITGIRVSDYMNYASLDVIKKSAHHSKSFALNKEDLKELF